MQAVADPILEEMISRIVRRFDPARTLLFGSRARGDHRPDSDYDPSFAVERAQSVLASLRPRLFPDT